MIPIQHQAETSLSHHRVTRLMAMEASRRKAQGRVPNLPLDGLIQGETGRQIQLLKRAHSLNYSDFSNN